MSDTDESSRSRHRLARSRMQIADQHAGLDGLQVEVQRALDEGDRASIEDAVRALSGALEAHFSLEERAYYPDRATIDAGLANRFDEFEGEHEQLRAELDDLRAAVVRGDMPALGGLFSIFAVALAQHEADEEKTMADLAERD